MRSLPSSILLFALLATGCKETTDLGTPCILRKADPADPTKSVPVKDSDIDHTKQLDYIAFGATECEDLVCVRTVGNDTPAAPDGSATGYCTTPCLSKNDCGETEKHLECSSLLLDQGFLDTLRVNDPKTFEENFGQSANSKFCAKPRP